MNPKVDFFFEKAGKWQQEYKKLRTIIMDCGLTEELKWGKPCYTFKNPGRQRGYLLWVEKYTQQILERKGLNDQ